MGLFVVAGRVTTLEGVTTVRVTVLLGLFVVVVSVLEEETFVPELFADVGFVDEKFVAEDSVLEVVTLVVGTETPVLVGRALMSVGLLAAGFVSVRAPVIIGVVGVAEVEVLLPPLLKELPAPVVPPASPS